MKLRLLVTALVVTLALGFATSASAVPITIAVNGWGPQSFPFNSGYPGDTLQLMALAATLDLAIETPTTAKINTLKWTLDYSGGSNDPSDHDFDFTFTRDIFIGLLSNNLMQAGQLKIRYYNDTLSWSTGSTVTFNFGSYTLDVTPLGHDPIVRDALGEASYDVEAEFLLHQVPDGGATLTLLGGALMGLGILRRKARG